MPATRYQAEACPPNSSLRGDFAATFAGNTVFAASQWAALSLIARLGGTEMLGEYALALAVVTPVALLSHLNLRAVLATDMERRHPFGDYLGLRLWTAALGLLAVFGIAWAGGYAWPVALVIAAAGVVLTADNFSDLYYGALQRRQRMGRIARSAAARGVLSVAALGVALWLTRSLLAAVCAQAAGRLLVLLVYDRPKGQAGESLAGSGIRNQTAILRTALPLGVVLMFVSLASSLPRYAIENRLGMVALGVFTAPASFITVGATLVNALGQAATPRLARAFAERDARGFRRLAAQLTASAGLLGVAGIGAALVAGRFALRLVYGPAYSASSGLLVWLMGAGLVSYLAGALGYVITGARAFAAQAPLFAAVAAVAGLASWLLVPRLGLEGAALALAVSSLVQLLGALLILRRSLRAPRECAP
ncbi:MAG: oligosaccharide flippase family protein [Bryobacteraceae bacterium]|jgi:O-antigen/teichoic acid export membrane protein